MKERIRWSLKLYTCAYISEKRSVASPKILNLNHKIILTWRLCYIFRILKTSILVKWWWILCIYRKCVPCQGMNIIFHRISFNGHDWSITSWTTGSSFVLKSFLFCLCYFVNIIPNTRVCNTFLLQLTISAFCFSSSMYVVINHFSGLYKCVGSDSLTILVRFKWGGGGSNICSS